jgi:NitT/TauT family transport system substrate-binding protein
MTWQLNEINALIWPSPNGIGAMDKAAWDQTVNISTTYQVLKKNPTDGAYRTDLAKKAADALKSSGADITGTGFKKATVQVTAGGN